MPSSMNTYGGDANHFYRFVSSIVLLVIIVDCSFNVGPAHVIGFSSEFYYYTEFGFEQIVNQYKWLEQDLIIRSKEANIEFKMIL